MLPNQKQESLVAAIPNNIILFSDFIKCRFFRPLLLYSFSLLSDLAKCQRQGELLQRTFHRCCLPSFGSFGEAVSEEMIVKNRSIRNRNCLWQPCLLMDRDEMSNMYR
jgi:hypothetical protein